MSAELSGSRDASGAYRNAGYLHLLQSRFSVFSPCIPWEKRESGSCINAGLPSIGRQSFLLFLCHCFSGCFHAECVKIPRAFFSLQADWRTGSASAAVVAKETIISAATEEQQENNDPAAVVVVVVASAATSAAAEQQDQNPDP